MTAPDTLDDAQAIFHLNLFQTLGDAQSAHGIPLLDYGQYHAYCTKRLHRIRHHRDVRSQLVHSVKYRKQPASSSSNNNTAQTGGDRSKKGKAKATGGRHAFCPQPAIPENGVVSHDYMLWNLIFQAERAWAMACSLQGNNSGAAARKDNSTETNENKKKAKTKSRILSRLNKAVHWARVLEDTVTKTNCVSEVTRREINSYLMWMMGNQQLQRENYAAAFHHFAASRTTLIELAATPSGASTANATESNEGPATNSAADAEQVALQDIWTDRADNLLLPLIRYCQYEAKDEDLVHNEGTENSFSSNKVDSNTISIEFCNKRTALDSYPQLALLYLKLEKRLTTDSSSGMTESAFLQCLSDIDDALRMSVQELQRYENLPDGPAVQAKRKELTSVRAFFEYQKLSLQRQHQEDQLGKDNIFTADAAEMFHVYESLLSNVQAMADLNQDTNDPNYNPEDDPLWLEAQTHVVRIRALRCFQLARLYESPMYLSGTTTSQVLALLHQCNRLQRRAAEEVAACEFGNAADGDKYQDQLDSLKIHIQGMLARVNSVRFLEKRETGSTLSKATNRPLWLRLRDLDAGTVLADQDPSPLFLPIPCKPVFYDVAWEQVTDSAASMQILDECITANEPKKKSGPSIFSWFSSGS